MKDTISLFLCGDVMTGRGIDQILPHPNPSELHESYVRDAREYVMLAKEKEAQLSVPVSYAYVWGDALKEFRRVRPDFKIINLETTITTSDEWLFKGINYRMHPANLPTIEAAKINCCALANNHMLDFGYSGLLETLESLDSIKVRHAGAGKNVVEAQRPVLLTDSNRNRLWVFSYGMDSSGVPPSWAATRTHPGVAFLENLSKQSVHHIRDQVSLVKEPGDLVLLSIHWGGNWGYEISHLETQFAHAVIDEAFVDIVHGHSSHHPKAVELYHQKPIFYGCGDFINDYEGITGYEKFRGDLGLMYFIKIDRSDRTIVSLEMVPTQMRALHVVRASPQDAQWLTEILDRESKQFGVRVELNAKHNLEVIPEESRQIA